ncbi:HpcH/HpaI aldolase/citrate lyase family protein [Halorubrum vacuolatum]|uniref:Citrate lyase subunit beta / citryl-CoA lyase n=1 Tax=Halorubrum vacuolatum TaxID=63740 RepID=A0A238ULH1_HALVU|nr:CoA ester lyase [Halorubrum vacuolatum]SNR22966.1 citrate lyase subunit beta / citryl-CoA lyase [Halorubrum vacuolatum]
MTRRSLLFTPGDRPKLLWKAADAGADVVCFDLEDAVAPGRKAEARETVREVLADPGFTTDAEVCVRLTAEPADDLDALVGGSPGAGEDAGSSGAGEDAGSSGAGEDGGIRLDAVMLPKVETAKRIETVAAMCAERGLDVVVLALIETAAGVLSAPDIADAGPTDALLFGAEDLAADLGATRTAEGTEVLYARERVVVAASAAGIDAIDTVYTDFEDTDGLREETAFAATLGYDGKLAIHPAQVPVINDAYTPTAERVAWAEAVIEARDDAADDDRAVFEVDGEMIDAPLIAQAERILDRAQAAGIR